MALLMSRHESFHSNMRFLLLSKRRCNDSSGCNLRRLRILLQPATGHCIVSCLATAWIAALENTCPHSGLQRVIHWWWWLTLTFSLDPPIISVWEDTSNLLFQSAPLHPHPLPFDDHLEMAYFDLDDWYPRQWSIMISLVPKDLPWTTCTLHFLSNWPYQWVSLVPSVLIVTCLQHH